MMMITTMAKKIRHFFPETREREREKEEEEEEEKNATRTLSPFLSLSLSFERAPRLFKRPAASKENREEGERQKTPSFERERPNNEKGACFCPKTSQTLNNTAHKKKEKKEFNNSPECIFCTFLYIFTCEKNTNTTYYILYRTTRRLCDRYTHYISSTRFSRREEEETQNTEPL